MWVTWQLFLTASVTKGNATSVTRLTSAGHLHCRLQLLCSLNRPFQTRAMKGLRVFPSLCAEERVLGTRKTALSPDLAKGFPFT